MRLSKSYVQSNEAASHGLEVKGECLNYPERIIQIGEGNFLRGFVDWAVHRTNQDGVFEGRVVVVAPRPSGRHNIESLNQQDGLYTVWLRGLHDGRTVDTHEVVTSISRAIDPYHEWESFLDCASVESIDVFVSNTTEAGLVYEQEPFDMTQPIQSFPGKLTAYLYRRFEAFKGNARAGMTIVPCELIEDNGDMLRSIVLRHAQAWGLPEAFQAWVVDYNQFCNTLVDRIVTGQPSEGDKKALEQATGYHDELITVGEPFMLWVIEGDDAVRAKLPFGASGLDVRVVPSVAPFRLIKVRILNGAHTSMSSIAQLAGLTTVGETVGDPLLGTFISQIIDDEIVPVLVADGLSEDELRTFASNTLERFKNPFIRHELKNLSLNGLSKICVRILPSIRGYAQLHGRAPQLLTLAFAGHLLYYRDAKDEDGEWRIQDDIPSMNALFTVWEQSKSQPTAEVVKALLALQEVWGDDLNEIAGLTESVVRVIDVIEQEGVKAAIQRFTGTPV